MVSDILNGSKAMRDRRVNSVNPYLPKFPEEATADYEYRVTTAKFTNIYRDIVESLAAKPFTKEVKIEEGAPELFKTFVEDVDGSGNHLHVFAQNSFFHGINNAIDFIVVDYVKVAPGSTLADERKMNARPYWVHVPAERMIALYSARIGAKEELVHARIFESGTVQDGYDEQSTNRIRVYNRAPITDEAGTITGYEPATYEVYEQHETKSTGGAKSSSWQLIDSGPLSIGIIPVVPVIMGRRVEGTWRFIPPLQDAAYLQIEHFQQETGLKSIKELTAFPMLVGSGFQPPLNEANEIEPVPTGPRAILYAPPTSEGSSPDWKFIEPSAQSLKFLAEEVKTTEQQLREIGRQPLTAQTGNLTVVTTAFAGDKANSVIQAWALNMKDALENALKITAMWWNMKDGPTVQIDTDFDIGLSAEKDPDFLLRMRANNDLSARALADEFKRRNILSAEYDFDEDSERLLEDIVDV